MTLNGHTFKSHKDCSKVECPGKDKCIHEVVAQCVVCLGANATLTQDCPGKVVDWDTQVAVKDIGLDYSDERGWHYRG